MSKRNIVFDGNIPRNQRLLALSLFKAAVLADAVVQNRTEADLRAAIQTDWL